MYVLRTCTGSKHEFYILVFAYNHACDDMASISNTDRKIFYTLKVRCGLLGSHSTSCSNHRCQYTVLAYTAYIVFIL